MAKLASTIIYGQLQVTANAIVAGEIFSEGHKVWHAGNLTPYVHPTSSGNKHVPSGGAAGNILQWNADGTAAWKTNGTATQYLRGDGQWATPPDTKYTHPTAKQCSYSYTHPTTKQCNYTYTHPTTKQCTWEPPASHSHSNKTYLDSINQKLSTTSSVTFAKVYGAVYNDYAEYFLKDDKTIEPGDIVVKNLDGKGYIKSQEPYSKLVVGVMSTDYAQCIGGDRGVTVEEQEEKYTPVGIAGRVPVKVIGEVKIGDLIVSSDIPGVGMAAKEYIPGTVVGKALENYNSKSVGKIQMLIMNI